MREEEAGLTLLTPGVIVTWPVGDMHLTSFPLTSECEKFLVTNGEPWPIGDSTNMI